jgi:hypothetical protein
MRGGALLGPAPWCLLDSRSSILDFPALRSPLHAIPAAPVVRVSNLVDRMEELEVPNWHFKFCSWRALPLRILRYARCVIPTALGQDSLDSVNRIHVTSFY